MPPQYGPVPQPGGQASHRATSPPRQRSLRPWFWAFVAGHALMLIFIVGAGPDRSYGTTFDLLGMWAAADVMLAAGFGLWKITGRRG
jgi:hypothetical protein